MSRYIVLLCVVGALALPARAGDSIPYQVFDLGDLGGGFSFGFHVNDANQVVGESTGPSGSRGFLWSGGGMAAVETGTGHLRVAVGINSAGTIVGAGLSPGGNGPHRFLNGNLEFLGHLGGGGAGVARGVNEAGLVVGWSRNALFDNEAFVWNGTMTGLGSFAGRRSEANACNDLGQVVGFAENAAGSARGFIWSGSGLADLGTLAGGPTYAHGLNNAGIVVGESLTANGFRAFVWQSGSMTPVPTLGGAFSVLVDINEQGLAVGISPNAAGVSRAAVYSASGGLVDLNSLVASGTSLELREAWSINESGAITGLARTSSGQSHAFLAIPVPGVGTGIALSVAGCCGAVRRRRATTRDPNGL